MVKQHPQVVINLGKGAILSYLTMSGRLRTRRLHDMTRGAHNRKRATVYCMLFQSSRVARTCPNTFQSLLGTNLYPRLYSELRSLHSAQGSISAPSTA